MEHHSKWPVFMRMHGSIIPEMILPIIVVAIWSTIITVISQCKFNRMSFPLFFTVLEYDTHTVQLVSTASFSQSSVS